MTPPRSSRASRFADEALVSFGRARFHERIASHEERTWRELEQQQTGNLDGIELTDAGTVVEIVGGGWRVRWVLASQSGAQVVRSVTLEPESATTPPGGVTTNLLRELSPQRALTAIAGQVPPVVFEWYSAPDAGAEHEPKSGRPRVTDQELASVATAYLEELQSGQSGITTRIRVALGYQKDSAVRDRIRMARDRGFLTPTKQGRRGGGPGPALLAYQAQTSEETSRG